MAIKRKKLTQKECEFDLKNTESHYRKRDLMTYRKRLLKSLQKCERSKQ